MTINMEKKHRILGFIRSVVVSRKDRMIFGIGQTDVLVPVAVLIVFDF